MEVPAIFKIIILFGLKWVDICVDRNFWVICGIFRKLNPESMIFFRNQFTCSLAISVQRQVVYTCIIYSSCNVPIRPSHLAN